MSAKVDLIKPMAAGTKYVNRCNGKSQEILPEVSIDFLEAGHTHTTYSHPFGGAAEDTIV